jgi:hypothetical protein
LGCELDTQKLPRREATELRRLIDQAGLETVPTRKNSRARDLTNYEISVKDDGRTITAAFDDLNLPGKVQPLLDFLKSRATARPLDD